MVLVTLNVVLMVLVVALVVLYQESICTVQAESLITKNQSVQYKHSLQDNSQDLQDHLQDIPHLLVHLSGVVLDPQTPKNHPDVPTRTPKKMVFYVVFPCVYKAFFTDLEVLVWGP